MKTKTLLLLLLFTSTIFSQIVNIPDPALKEKLLLYDSNQNGEIEVSEAESVTGPIFVNGLSWAIGDIVDMTGIEAFININELYCEYNQIEALDISQNTKLEILDCHNNNISSLNVTNCSLLRELYCHENNLSSLDISQNVVLENLRCYENYLVAINVSQNAALKNLFCSENYISALNVEQNILLEWLTCSNNLITNLNVSQNTQLEKLYFRNNSIMTIDVGQCALLERLGGEGNQLTNLDLVLNDNLIKVDVKNNQLTSMDIKNGNNSIITNFDTTNNPNLTCIFVDNVTYSTENWTAIDPNSTFVETQQQCNELGVTEEYLQENIHIYPNPCYNIITIENNYQISNNTFQITITDALGKILTTQYSILNTNINIKHFPQGIYCLIIQDYNNNQISTHKIIKL